MHLLREISLTYEEEYDHSCLLSSTYWILDILFFIKESMIHAIKWLFRIFYVVFITNRGIFDDIQYIIKSLGLVNLVYYIYLYVVDAALHHPA